MENKIKRVVPVPTREETIGITMRPSTALLAFYERIAERANRFRLHRGERGNVSVQKVMLHRLQSLPAYQAYLSSQKKDKT